MLPKNLIYVRHGESQRNLAGRKAYESGDMSFFEEIVSSPSSLALLSPLGVQQATITGEWMKRTLPFAFDRQYVSSMMRTRQTGGLLDLPGLWLIDNNLRERSGGDMEWMDFNERREYLTTIKNRIHKLDPFNFRPKGGESFADVLVRWQHFMRTLHTECSEMNAVCVVNHGDNMWLARYIHERWTPEEFSERRGENSHDKIPNCMVLHYTRENPKTGEALKYPGWVRTCCPWKDPTPTEWVPIERKKYTSSDLLAQVEASVERQKKAS